MFNRFTAFVAVLPLVAVGVCAQGLDTKASKNDWEEINFEFNSSVLVDGYPSLLRVAELLQTHPGYKVRVEGHTDIIGGGPYNEKLGQARADTVRDFVEAARASPQTLANYGSAGTGTVFHLTGELFKQLAGLQLQHVPYRGGAPTVTALLAGEIPLAFETMLALQPHVRAGTLRALAVTSTRRSAIMPEIPTSAEAGFPALVADNSYALFAPAGTPTPILTRLHDATVAALALPEVRDQLREQGAEVIGSSPAELATYVAAEIPKWAALARQAGVKP